ncbi:hypothetical protein ACU4GD_21450 [Cupriavidus basilensis]
MENEAQRQFLLSRGCHMGQGYLFRRARWSARRGSTLDHHATAGRTPVRGARRPPAIPGAEANVHVGTLKAIARAVRVADSGRRCRPRVSSRPRRFGGLRSGFLAPTCASPPSRGLVA